MSVSDLDADQLQFLLQQKMVTDELLGQEMDANAESSASIVRHAGATKFREVGPLESAAAEAVLKKAGP